MCVLYKSSHDEYRSRISRRSRAVDVKEMYQKEGLKQCRAQCYFSHKTNCFVDVVVVVVPGRRRGCLRIGKQICKRYPPEWTNHF